MNHETVVEAPVVEHIGESVDEIAEVVETACEEPVVARPRRNRR